jgi:2-polyprenyl-3-methyl-5-hydroxy-6-metoxy-1,4-benzoquinol methylase
MPDRKAHWEQIYSSRAPTEVSWFEDYPGQSLDLIAVAGLEKRARIIDVGGGASKLVDNLLALGFDGITVLDISSTAIGAAKERLGESAGKVEWIEADITEIQLPEHQYDLWHDRAVFHFLTNPVDRSSYVHVALNALKPGGYLIVATFALDGPEECSGLPTCRYSPEQLLHEFGPGFGLVASQSKSHRTPFGTEQSFVYCLLKRVI